MELRVSAARLAVIIGLDGLYANPCHGQTTINPGEVYTINATSYENHVSDNFIIDQGTIQVVGTG